MAGLLPSKPDIDHSDEPRVVGLDSDAADELIDALSSTTTREILNALHEEPAVPSALADRVGTSLQNVQYHLRKLEDAGLVEVGDTVYSEKGREMNVYVPADRALVVVAGREEETTGLKAALSRLLGGVGILGVASVLVDRLARRGLTVGRGAQAGGGGGDAGGAGAEDTPTPEAELAGDGGAGATRTSTPTDTAAPTEATPATETAAPTEADGGGVDIAEATTTTAGPTEEPAATETAVEATATGAPSPTATAEPATATVTPMPTEEPAAATATPVQTGTPTASPDLTAEAVGTTVAAQPSVVEGAASSPGLLFFLGGTTVLLGGFALWWVRR
jgi:DNA-binding transcriptional ArsR family regulator